MKKCKNFLVQLGRDEEGAALIEYSVLIGLITVAVIAIVVAVGIWVSDKWTALCTALTGCTP
jgi:pilus assembly protein Flp/PilA